MIAAVLHSLGSDPGASGLDPGDAGWGDVLFVSLWAVGSLLLASYYCYKAFFSERGMAIVVVAIPIVAVIIVIGFLIGLY